MKIRTPSFDNYPSHSPEYLPVKNFTPEFRKITQKGHFAGHFPENPHGKFLQIPAKRHNPWAACFTFNVIYLKLDCLLSAFERT